MFLTNFVYYVLLYVHVGLVMPSAVTSCVVSPGLAKYRGDSRSRDNYNHLPTSRTDMLPDTERGHILQQTDTPYDLWENCHDTNGGMSCCYATGDSTWSDNGGSVRADLSCPSPLFLRPYPLRSDVVVLTKGMQWS